MLAIPVFRTRVAPVLDWCTTIIVVPENSPDIASGRQIAVMHETLFRLVRTLREQGLRTLICGALSREMLSYCESIGLRIVHGVSGEIAEVLQAYREGNLNQPKFWLPGCAGQRRYRGAPRCAGSNADGARGVNGDKFPGAEPAGGPDGFCVCPKCGLKKRHERGIPCSQVRCPACQISMTRG